VLCVLKKKTVLKPMSRKRKQALNAKAKVMRDAKRLKRVEAAIEETDSVVMDESFMLPAPVLTITVMLRVKRIRTHMKTMMEQSQKKKIIHLFGLVEGIRARKHKDVSYADV